MADRGEQQSGAGRPNPSEPTPGATGKGHPTPKRRTAQEANKRPLVPSDRKAAARASREKQRAARAKVQQAMITGDERYLPPRDKGPIRRYVRDYIDARWNVGEFFLPGSLGIVLVVLLGGTNPQLALGAILALYLLVGVAVFDAAFAATKIKKRVRAKFGDVPKGTLMYGALRAFQIRPTRMPRPMVSRGRYPS